MQANRRCRCTAQRYNDKQKYSDRKIENYYTHIEKGRQEKLFHEAVFQIGNVKDTAVGTAEGEQAKVVLGEFMNGFAEYNPNLRVFSAHLHMDEATPYLHIDFVPFTTGSKRGLDTRVSLKKALAAQGFEGGSREDTELNQWINSEKEALTGSICPYLTTKSRCRARRSRRWNSPSPSCNGNRWKAKRKFKS